jgi:hypothetical protein
MQVSQMSHAGRASPVLTVFCGQCSVQFFDHAAGGQRPVDSGEMRRPRGSGNLSSERWVRALHAGALEERGLACGMGGSTKTITLHVGALPWPWVPTQLEKLDQGPAS